MLKRCLIIIVVLWLAISGLCAANDIFTFAVMGDSRGDMPGLRCTDDNSGVSVVLRPAVESILARNADIPIRLLLFSGDMISGYFQRDAPSTAQCNRVQFHAWHETIKPLLDANIAVRVTPGNHDIAIGRRDTPRCGDHNRPYKSDRETIEVFKQAFGDMLLHENPGPDSGLTYSFDKGGCHFALLAAYSLTRHNAFSDRTLRWLDDDLRRARERGLKLFVMSHPPAFPGGGHMWDSLPFYDPTYTCDNYSGIDRRLERDRFWNILKKHGVIAYFCGHEHNIQVQRVQGVWHVVAGGMTAKLYPLNGSANDKRRNTILYDGQFQDPLATVNWPWSEPDRPSLWGWCLISVEQKRVIMRVIASRSLPASGDDLIEMKSFVLWTEGATN